MNFNELVVSRYSVRSYSKQSVDRSLILEILEVARLAPSACNYQPWHFIVITDPEILSDFQDVYPRNWFREAPVCIVICSDHLQSWKRKSDGKDFSDLDIAITIDHLVLKATDLGLGTCWICNFDVVLARQKLQLPRHMDPMVLISLGYPNGVAPKKVRKPLSEIVSWEKFTNP